MLSLGDGGQCGCCDTKYVNEYSILCHDFAFTLKPKSAPNRFNTYK